MTVFVNAIMYYKVIERTKNHLRNKNINIALIVCQYTGLFFGCTSIARRALRPSLTCSLTQNYHHDNHDDDYHDNYDDDYHDNYDDDYHDNHDGDYNDNHDDDYHDNHDEDYHDNYDDNPR